MSSNLFNSQLKSEYKNYSKYFSLRKKRSINSPPISAWQSNKTKFLKLFIKLICLVVCLSFFLYETSELVSLYWSGKTLVENRVERFTYSQLPAITVCLPSFMDMKKFAGFFMNKSEVPEHQKLYKEFLMFENKSIYSNGEVDEGFQKHLYWNFQWKAYATNMELFTLEDIFDKISLDIVAKHKIHSIAFNESGIRLRLPEPQKVYSIVPYQEPRKCVTLFSDFDKNFGQKKYELVHMEIIFQHPMIAFPIEKYYKEDLYVSLHSPNILPDYTRENVFQKLEMGITNFITYAESQTLLLPPPYRTQCKNYVLDDFGNQDLRTDCIFRCITDKMSRRFGLTCIWTYSNNKLIRNLFNISQMPLCDHANQKYKANKWIMTPEQFTIEKECLEVCPKNCKESFYSYEIEFGKGSSNRAKEKNTFTLHIEHSRFPDQVIEHRPILGWTTLVSNLGGLLGMWMGFSILFSCNTAINKIFG